MKKMFLAAAFAISAYAAPAAAADPKTLSCVIVELPAEHRKALMEAGGKIGLQQEKNLPEAAIAALGTTAQACKVKHGWSDEALKAAVTYGLAQAAYVGAVLEAEKIGIKEGPFLNSLAALTEEQRQGVLKQDTPSLEAFVAKLLANGIDVNDEKKGVFVGVLAAFWMLSDNNKTAFAAA